METSNLSEELSVMSHHLCDQEAKVVCSELENTRALDG